MGECKMETVHLKKPCNIFNNVVRIRQRNIAGWEALVRCLYKAGMYNEALIQAQLALNVTDGKPLFFFTGSRIVCNRKK